MLSNLLALFDRRLSVVAKKTTDTEETLPVVHTTEAAGTGEPCSPLASFIQDEPVVNNTDADHVCQVYRTRGIDTVISSVCTETLKKRKEAMRRKRKQPGVTLTRHLAR